MWNLFWSCVVLKWPKEFIRGLNLPCPSNVFVTAYSTYRHRPSVRFSCVELYPSSISSLVLKDNHKTIRTLMYYKFLLWFIWFTKLCNSNRCYKFEKAASVVFFFKSWGQPNLLTVTMLNATRNNEWKKLLHLVDLSREQKNNCSSCCILLHWAACAFCCIPHGCLWNACVGLGLIVNQRFSWWLFWGKTNVLKKKWTQ